MSLFKINRNGHSFLVIWNKEIPNRLFGEEISISNISIGFDLLKDDSDFVIILAELTWNSKKYSDFYGFDIACELRLKHRILAPIIMVSFLPENFFNGDTRYNILKARGTSFLQLPFDSDSLDRISKQTRALTPSSLADISVLLLNPRHLIDRFTHDIRYELGHDTLKAKATTILADLPDQFKKSTKWEKLIESLSEKNISEEEFYLRKKAIILKLNTTLLLEGSDPQNTTKYKLLLLEDNLEDAETIRTALNPFYEITNVTNGEDAIRIIDEDLENHYCALICDWRLLVPGTDRQQQWQGYEVMEYASKNRFYALFSLTSLDEDSRKYISPYISCTYTPLTKDFEKGNGLWLIYMPIINQKIEENLAVIAGLPTGEGWYKQDKADYKKDASGNKSASKKSFASFHQQYIEKRNSNSFRNWNNEISDLANRMWAYYKKSLSSEPDRSLQDIAAKWGIELNRNVKNVLVIRRLYLALWYSQSRLEITIRISLQERFQAIENPVLNIYSVLRNRYWNDQIANVSSIDIEDIYKKLLSAAKAFVSQLALEPSSLPSGILPEEKAWLNSIGINLKLGNDVDYYGNTSE